MKSFFGNLSMRSKGLKQALFLALIVAIVMAAALPGQALAAKKYPTLSADKQYIFNAWLQGGRMYIYVTNLQADHSFLVKTRNWIQGIGPWYDLEKLNIAKGATVVRGYDIPAKLKHQVFIMICLKERNTAERVCRTIYNPDFVIQY